VSWITNRGASGNANGTSNWTVSGIALQSGTNIVTVTARDAAGNIAARGGTTIVRDPWALNDAGLSALAYEYRIG
jgi:hypothetical protein